jgi:threonine synthase
MIPFQYRCTLCGRSFGRNDVRYLCPVCSKDYTPGIPLRGVLEAVLDYAELRKRFDRSMPDWDLFSTVEREYYPPYPVGSTPFFPSRRLGKELGLNDLWLKNDGLNPSGSLKDRASFLVVAEAQRLHERRVVTASTGNAASALAAVCAAAGLEAIIFVPATAPRAKLVQMLLYGATVVPVRGSYDEAFRLSLEYTARESGLNRNTAYHPLTIEGKKTVALEICAQNGLRLPDVMVVSAGDGAILGGVYKACVDLRESGIITTLPRLMCVQAEHSDAIHRYITTGQYADAPSPKTVADSISVRTPSNAHMARRAVVETGGASVTVSDQEILEAQVLLAQTTGVFAEPAAAAAVAGARKFKENNAIFSNEQVVVLITGHGLKDVDAAQEGIHLPAPVDPDIDQVRRFLARSGR